MVNDTRSDFHAVRSACGGEKLTLVVDEAVGGQQFEGVDLEQDSVEQKVMSGRTVLGFVTQTRLGELLQKATGRRGLSPTRNHMTVLYDPRLLSITLCSRFDSWHVLLKHTL